MSVALIILARPRQFQAPTVISDPTTAEDIAASDNGFQKACTTLLIVGIGDEFVHHDC
jgi:hypothetical protein